MLESDRMRLLGYDNPLGMYPAPVTAIGTLGGLHVGVFHGSSEPLEFGYDRTFSKIVELTTEYLDSKFLEAFMGGEQTAPTDLDNIPFSFDYREYDLYALGEGKVVVYATAAKADFFSILLSIKSFADENPFIRLGIAEVVRERTLLIEELKSCIRCLFTQSPDTAAIWYTGRLTSLPEDERKHYRLPDSWIDLFEGEDSQIIGTIKPWYVMKFPRMIRPQLVEAYTEYVNALGELEAEIEVDIPGAGRLTRPRLLNHLINRDKIGTKWAEIILDGIYVNLGIEQRKQIWVYPQRLVSIAITEFERATKERTQG